MMTKRLRFYFFIFLPVLMLSCRAKSQETNDNKIVVQLVFSKQEAKSLFGKYVYLVDFVKKKTIDSVIVEGNTVVLNEKWDSSFVPYMVSVNRMDTFQGHPYLRLLGFKTPYRAKTYETTPIYSFFYLDKGITVIRAYSADDSTFESGFTGSKQNDPYLRTIGLQVPGNDSAKRQSIVDRNVSIIQSYPYSIHFLTQLFRDKENFSDSDLKKMLLCFDGNIQKTPMYKSFGDYFSSSSSFDKAFPASIQLEDNAGNYQKIGNDSAVYNLIVYWASWCGPCRKEIPELKSLYKKFGRKGLSITSISLDEDKRNWQVALAQEQMPWQQLIAVDSTRTVVDLHYSIKAIPKMYLFDWKKRLLGTSENDYITPDFIDTLLDNKL